MHRFELHESKVILNNILNEEGNVPVENKIILTLVNIHQNTSKDFPKQSEAISSLSTSKKIEIDYNLYVLVTQMFDNYNEALKFLFETNSFFQEKPIFTPTNTPALDFGISKLALEIENLNYSEMQNI